MKKAFIVDVSRCNGCYNCQIACKDEHCGNDWSPYAKPQPDTGQFWLKLEETVRGTVPKVKVSYRPHLCMHCDNAACLKACPVEGGIYRRADGLVIIDPARCTGCQNCVDVCPYHVIYFNKDLNIAQKCTGCAHLLDNGWKEPRCVDACPTQALKFVDEAELSALKEKAQVWRPELEARPNVYYANLPKKFIAGTVYDPIAKEIVKDAACTLTDLKNHNVRVTRTNGFGDFWFEGLEIGRYSLRIESAQFPTFFKADIDTEKDVNLGDIPLT